MTANTLVQGQMVKGQGHSVRNRQHGFTAKLVGLSCLFNLSGGRFHGHVAPNGCQAEVHKTSDNNIFKPKKTKNPEYLARCRSAFEMQCFRNFCKLSSYFVLCTVDQKLAWLGSCTQTAHYSVSRYNPLVLQHTSGVNNGASNGCYWLMVGLGLGLELGEPQYS